MSRRTWVLALALAAQIVAGAARADAQADAQTAAKADAPAAAGSDSSLHRFLGSLADSTDRYFGLIAAPVDTAGLDSTLEARLEKPWGGPRRRAYHSILPMYRFLRVDGSLWGGKVSLGNLRERWQVSGDVGYADGSNTWLGGGEVSVSQRKEETVWRLTVAGGRRTEPINRDWDEFEIAALRALFSGNDNQSYLRRDGFAAGLTRVGGGWRAALKYRYWREAPLAVASTYNFAHDPLVNPGNLAATRGRAGELGIDGLTRIPGTLFRAQLGFRWSDDAIGSDFDYRRLRLGLAGDLPAGRHASFVPQAVYGRLSGDAVPQAEFYLGGPGTLRSVPTESFGGTGLAVGRLDVIGHDDILALMHIPHPAMFPIQIGLFAATGAVWGPDPFGGPGTDDETWPEVSAWRSEAGFSFLYRPGLPDEEAYLKINAAWPVGPVDHEVRWSVTYSRALDLLKPF
jgi:hypothetical protein